MKRLSQTTNAKSKNVQNTKSNHSYQFEADFSHAPRRPPCLEALATATAILLCITCINRDSYRIINGSLLSTRQQFDDFGCFIGFFAWVVLNFNRVFPVMKNLNCNPIPWTIHPKTQAPEDLNWISTMYHGSRTVARHYLANATAKLLVSLAL